MKPTLESTLEFATEKHRGQTDKAGRPYIFHPIRVMENLGPDASDEERVAALLHDVVEDCSVSLGDLRDAGYPEAVVTAVDHLTKDAEGERDYSKAIERAARNPMALRVKIADLTDNSRTDRIPHPAQEDEERLEKYKKALEFLRSSG